jgi:hypothetical protein
MAAQVGALRPHGAALGPFGDRIGEMGAQQPLDGAQGLAGHNASAKLNYRMIGTHRSPSSSLQARRAPACPWPNEPNITSL